jgi:four helix bundle protein
MCDALSASTPKPKRNSINQVIRSSSAIGSSMAEAKGAQSRADFHYKMRIALKEARESHFWLRLLSKSRVMPETRFISIVGEANEIIAMLTKIAKKTNPENDAPAPTS